VEKFVLLITVVICCTNCVHVFDFHDVIFIRTPGIILGRLWQWHMSQTYLFFFLCCQLSGAYSLSTVWWLCKLAAWTANFDTIMWLGTRFWHVSAVCLDYSSDWRTSSGRCNNVTVSVAV